MRFAATHASVKRGTITIVLVLAGLGGRGPRAQDTASGPAGAPVRSIDVELVNPPGRPGTGAVFPAETLRRELRRVAAQECDAHAVEDALARGYRFLGYVPTLTVTCTATSLRVRVRESSAIVDLITFDPADLSRIGVKPDPDFEEKLHLYPVPADAPRAVLRSLLLTREGDLYNFERYRADSEALAKLGYAVAFIPGQPAEGSDYPRGASRRARSGAS